MYFLYSIALGLALVAALPYWVWQRLRHGKYRKGLGERFGGAAQRLAALDGGRPLIWAHAVSVGEVIAITNLVNGLRVHFAGCRVVVSTTTDTGQALARQRFGAENVFYFPLDFEFSVGRYVAALRPQLVVLAETEFWPNFLRLAKASGARIAVVNARISDRSFSGYKRFRRWLGRVLANVDLFLAQTEEDRTRLIEIGAVADRVKVSGNLKFDAPVPSAPPIVASLRQALAESGAGPVLVCGSTVEDEEPLLLAAFQNVLASYPAAVMLLAPRHPERFNRVAKLLEELGIRFWRRSLWAGEPLAGEVLLVDSIGELAGLYALADVAFVGGSLVPRGGHNILEPALLGACIVVGNHTENFRDVVNFFASRNAIRVVGPAELPLAFMDLISNEVDRTAMGRQASECVRAQMGATQRTLQALKRLLNDVT